MRDPERIHPVADPLIFREMLCRRTEPLHYVAGRDLVQLFDENDAFVAQIIDHIGLMHDVVTDINWCAKLG